MAKKWFVVRVQSGREDRARVGLDRRARAAGMEDCIGEVVVPSERVSEIRGGAKRVRERKIYPGYMMIEVEVDEDDRIPEDTWFLIRETPAIGDFVGAGTVPNAMTEDDVEKIVGDAERRDEAPALRIGFREGETVRIKEGPFENFDGVVEEVSAAKGLVKVMVMIFGRPTSVELEYWQIESI